MTTKEDFMARMNASKRDAKTSDIILGTIFLAIMISNIPLAVWVDHHPLGEWMQVVYACTLTSYIIGILIVAFWFNMRRMRKYGLVCSDCGKPLVQISGQIAVATGKCCHCGAAIFET